MCEISYVIDIMVTFAESPSSVTLWVSTPGNCIEFVTLGEAQSSSGSREEASYSSSSDDVGTLELSSRLRKEILFPLNLCLDLLPPHCPHPPHLLPFPSVVLTLPGWGQGSR